MNAKKLTLMLLAATVLCSPAALAREEKSGSGGSQWHERMEAHHQQMIKELNLTPEQKTALEENKKKNREDAKKLFESMRQQRALMRQELQKENLDMAKINQIQGELKTIQSKMLDQRLTGILEVRKILTPEQFKKFSDKMDERREHGGHHTDGKDKHERKDK